MSVSPKGNGILDEMAIVDVLTRLIFDADAELQGSERLLLELLEQVDESLLGAPRRDISEYLRSMGVDEMILLVNRLKQMIDHRHHLIASQSVSKITGLHH